MDTIHELGLVEIQGEDVWGGEMIPPNVMKLIFLGAGAAIVAVANNWSVFKKSFAQGFAAGASGNW